MADLEWCVIPGGRGWRVRTARSLRTGFRSESQAADFAVRRAMQACQDGFEAAAVEYVDGRRTVLWEPFVTMH